MFWKSICYPAIKVHPNTSIANCICSASPGVRISERYATASFLVSQEKKWLKRGLKKKQEELLTSMARWTWEVRVRRIQASCLTLPWKGACLGEQEEASAEWVTVRRVCKQTIGIIPAFFPHMSWTSPSLDRGKGTGKLQCCELFYSLPTEVLSSVLDF